ncbi:hypothetical protein TWF106_010080 [Orbilia oligospora]|uniref:Uncharacterized protein n=1 Tax=Orbilia oligospora TaxID=2813651 RepID=A0A7C8QG82_ORBOL|nr:hypothetical protein TWF106_010080 [Orbilia oligospora]
MSGRQLSDLSLQLSHLNLRSKRSAQSGLHRDRYVLFLGPDRTKFTIRAQNFNLFAPDFDEEVSSWPQLSAHAAKITFDFCAARYLGHRGADDIEALRACSDVYTCADEWGIQSLKTYICQILSTSNVLRCIDDYATFLGQVYRLYVHFADDDKTLNDAVTKCLRTIAEEHSQYAGTKRRTLRNPKQHLMTREQEMHDILSTEFTWLERDCFCKFCKHQRRSYGRGKPGPFWIFKVAQADLEHDSKAIWASGLAPIKFLFKYMFSTWAFTLFGCLFLTLGPKILFKESIKGLIMVLGYLSLLVALQCAIVIVISLRLLFGHAEPLFTKITRLTRWLAWKIAFPPIPKTELQLARFAQRGSYFLIVLFLWVIAKAGSDYIDGTGPFDELTRIVMKDNPRLAWERIYQYYRGLTDPSFTSSWVPQFEKYLEKIEKGRSV